MPARPTYSPMTAQDGAGDALDPSFHPEDRFVSALVGDMFGERDSNFIDFSRSFFVRLRILPSSPVTLVDASSCYNYTPVPPLNSLFLPPPSTPHSLPLPLPFLAPPRRSGVSQPTARL
jgi:hypothetical protein